MPLSVLVKHDALIVRFLWRVSAGVIRAQAEPLDLIGLHPTES